MSPAAPAAVLLILMSLLLSACGSDDGWDFDTKVQEWLNAEPGPPDLPSEFLPLSEELEAGADLVGSQGCLGCHMIGETGGDLGPSLDRVGTRLTRAQIGKAIVVGPDIMPSYQGLRQASRSEFSAMVDFLSALGTEVTVP